MQLLRRRWLAGRDAVKTILQPLSRNRFGGKQLLLLLGQTCSRNICLGRSHRSAVS